MRNARPSPRAILVWTSRAGWSGPDLNGCDNTAVTIPAGSLYNRTYVAHWEQYVVSFDPNGGYGVMTDQALITGPLNNNTFAKKGYTFGDGTRRRTGPGPAIPMDSQSH